MEKKHNVLIVHNYYQIPGGEDTVVYNEKQMLEKNGHSVILYTRHNSELNKMNFVRKLMLPFGSVFSIKTYRDVRKIIKRNNIDIVHVHNTLSLISPSVYYAAVGCHVPVVQTVHNFRLLCPAATFFRDDHVCEECVEKGLGCSVRHKCYRNSALQTLISVIILKFHRMTGIYKKINYIVLTEFNKSKLLQLEQIHENKVFIKPNFTLEGPKNDTNENGDYYLFVGRLEKIKGVDVVIRAFNKMTSKKLLIAGDGPGMQEYKQISESNITFLGYCDREKISGLMNHAKAVITASQWYETFLLVAIEAFSAKCPVISGDFGNAADLVDEGVNGYKFHYNDSDSLVKVVTEFEKNDREQLAENAYKKYKDVFSEESNYKALMRIYEAIS